MKIEILVTKILVTIVIITLLSGCTMVEAGDPVGVGNGPTDSVSDWTIVPPVTSSTTMPVDWVSAPQPTYAMTYPPCDVEALDFGCLPEEQRPVLECVHDDGIPSGIRVHMGEGNNAGELWTLFMYDNDYQTKS